jgi:hypothetical protein
MIRFVPTAGFVFPFTVNQLLPLVDLVRALLLQISAGTFVAVAYRGRGRLPILQDFAGICRLGALICFDNQWQD